MLSEGGESHHSTPQTIQMKLPSGELACTDKGNTKVFAEYFTKVLNNHKQMDDSVVEDITLREVMHE